MMYCCKRVVLQASEVDEFKIQDHFIAMYMTNTFYEFAQVDDAYTDGDDIRQGAGQGSAKIGQRKYNSQWSGVQWLVCCFMAWEWELTEVYLATVRVENLTDLLVCLFSHITSHLCENVLR